MFLSVERLPFEQFTLVGENAYELFGVVLHQRVYIAELSRYLRDRAFLERVVDRLRQPQGELQNCA